MKKKLMIALIPFLLLGALIGRTETRESAIECLRLFETVLRIVKHYYVKDVALKELTEKALEGMLSSLDPHSEFLTEKEMKELELHTTGEYGGLGIQIGMVGGVLTIIAPIEDTPAWRAGLMAGDRIIKIDGESTEDMTLDDAVKRMRGKPGTQVTLTISREGLDEPFDVTITRAMIVLHPVSYVTMLRNDIGYIKLSNFSERASREVRKAIDSLLSQGAKRIILDLRGNPGGLLSEAIKVAELFLDEGDIIVSTRGRYDEKEYRAHPAEKFEKFPLAVLVDGGSASASEIVAGAIQDWDRGIIVGTRTFGKGSVQRPFPVGKNEGVKLTTALYYTPSGRCISRHWAKEDTAKTYTTLGFLKREVHGGGGIKPDVEVKGKKWTSLESKLYLKRAFFRYAVHAGKNYKERGKDFEITDKDLEDFRRFVEKEDLCRFNECEWEEAGEGLKKDLKIAIYENLWGKEGRYRALLSDDPQLEKAIEILSSASSWKDVFQKP